MKIEVDNDDGWQNGKMTANFTWKRGRLYDRAVCLIIYDLCVDEPRALMTQVQSRYVQLGTTASSLRAYVRARVCAQTDWTIPFLMLQT